jgi:serine/threonine protein kinase
MPILTVHSSGKLPYIVMPYVACESLQQRIDRTGPLELVDILRIGVQTANGLAAAHAQGLVHRDVKPANILLEIGVERVMLTDFGLARAIDDASITRTGVIAGTPLYMSPEQARGEAIDARSDLFSLGSVLYTLATGRPPFRAESTYGILRRLNDDAPRPLREISPQFPSWFAMIVHKLLAKQPGERFASASQFAHTLEQCLAHVQQPTAVELPLMCQLPVEGKRWWLWAGVWSMLVGGSLVTLAMAFIPDGQGARPTKSLAQPGPPESPGSTDLRESRDVDPATEWTGDDLKTLQQEFDDWHRRSQKLWE